MLPTPDGRCFRHRFIGAYTPWNPEGAGDISHFWRDMTHLCQSTTLSWTMAGDVNATVASFKCLSGGDNARDQYLKFLTDTDGHDLWLDVEEHSCLNDWPCRSSHDTTEGNIINSVVTSQASRVDSEIFITDQHSDWIAFTDHRAVVAHITHAMPGPALSNSRALVDLSMGWKANSPRVKIPHKTKKHKYQVFHDQVDRRVKAKCIHECPVIDDDSFIKRYTELTEIITSVASNVFGHTKQYCKHAEVITNGKIKGIVADMKLVGGAIHFEKSGLVARVSLKVRNLHTWAQQDFSCELSDGTFVQYLAKKRRGLYKVLFAVRSKEILLHAHLGDKRWIVATLKGGSTQ